MADVVNLSQARKDRERRDAQALASQNRALHGRTRAEKARDRTEAERLARMVDGARRDSSFGPDGES